MDKLKAYEVREPDEGNCVIVYADTNVVARREGAGELGCEFEEVDSCLRAPWADQYAPGPVPLHASLANGWWHSCSGCGCEFDAQGIRGLDEDKQPEIDPVQDSEHNNYCSHGCMMARWQHDREHKAREAAAIEYCLSRWPDALRVWPFKQRGGAGFDPDACTMILPGLRNNITWVLGQDTVSVSQVDVPDFQQLYGEAARSARAGKQGAGAGQQEGVA